MGWLDADVHVYNRDGPWWRCKGKIKRGNGRGVGGTDSYCLDGRETQRELCIGEEGVKGSEGGTERHRESERERRGRERTAQQPASISLSS